MEGAQPEENKIQKILNCYSSSREKRDGDQFMEVLRTSRTMLSLQYKDWILADTIAERQWIEGWLPQQLRQLQGSLREPSAWFAN